MVVGRRLSTLLTGIAIILLWPSDAWAWGPATHVDLGLEVLARAALLAPALRRLLLAHADDFLYGCCAADIVIGKNLARYRHHCHNWQVGMRILDAARGARERAFGYGFLSHLAADTVAHNYYVPYKSVESFRAVAARHAYWELRFDKAALERPGVAEAFRRITRTRFHSHDEFLGRQLDDGASRLFSFKTSRRIFSSVLRLSRLRRWQRTLATLADRSPLPLTDDELRDFRRETVDAIFAFLIDAGASRTATVDPTGARSLRVAKEVRRELRALWRRGLPDAAWQALAHDLRRRFHEGMYGRLDMPDVGSLVRRARRSSSHGHAAAGR